MVSVSSRMNIDRTDREKQRANVLIYDKDFLLSLRKPDTKPAGIVEQSLDDDEIPAVFSRLTNPKMYVHGDAAFLCWFILAWITFGVHEHNTHTQHALFD